MMRTSTSIGDRAADAVERPLLQDAQELALRRRRELADLVEEDRAAVGQLELAQPARGRAREGAPLVAEELALEQRLGNRGAVDRDEGAVAPGRERVDRAREELLARAALALEQDGGVGRGDALGLGAHARGSPPTRRRSAAASATAPRRRAGTRRERARRSIARATQQAQQVRVDGLGDEVLGAALHRLDGRLDRAERRHDDARAASGRARSRRRGRPGRRRRAAASRSGRGPTRSPAAQPFDAPAAPLPTPVTSRPSALSISSSIARRESLSSTIRMRAMEEY